MTNPMPVAHADMNRGPKLWFSEWYANMKKDFCLLKYSGL